MKQKLKKEYIPLYYQLERTLRKRILTGKITPNERFPTEIELEKEFGVSRITVRQALMLLENEGLIVRQQGRGTFVIENPSKNLPYELYGYVDDLFYLGQQTQLCLYSKKLVKADSQLAKEMGIEEGKEVFLIEGIRYLPGKYPTFFQAHLLKDIGTKISLKKLNSPFLISEVEKVSLQRVKKAHQTISAAIADKKLAIIMKVKIGHPLLVVKRIYYSKDGKVLERAVTYFPGDIYQSEAKLERIPP
jgi:GntR family transcriptional regulator